jgi:succinate-acetate transporter protein
MLTVVHAGGYLGLVAAALAAYLSSAEVCEATYERPVLPVGRWPRTDLRRTVASRR